MLNSEDVKAAIKNTRDKKPLAKRLTTYGVAAASAAITGLAADNASADLVTVPVNIISTGSNEIFVNIQGFAAGATTFGVSYASNGFSQANPLQPYSEFMIRGATNFHQFSPRNTAQHAAYINTATGPYVGVNVGSAFVLPSFGAGTFLAGPSNYNTNSPAHIMLNTTSGIGQFNPDGVNYFTFVNSGPGGDGRVYNGWASISAAGGTITITALHVDTIPEPSSMALLCLGAVGAGMYRRRRRNRDKS